MKINIKASKEIIAVLWNLLRWHVLLTIAIYSLNVIAQISTIAFLLPIIQFMQLDGNIDYSQWYWNLIQKILSVVGQQVSFLNVILLSLFVITIYQAFQYLKELYTRNILWTIEYKLRNKVSLYILKGTYQSVLKYRKSELISYFIGQASRGASFFYVLFQYGFTILQSIMLLIFLCAISLQLTLVVFGYVMVQFFIVHWKTRVIQKLGYDIANRSDTILHVFQQHIFGYKFISVLKGNHVAAKKVLEPLTEQFRARVNFERTRGRLESSQEWMHISLILGMLYGSYAVWGFELAKILLFLFVLTRLVPVLKGYVSNVSQLKAFYPALKKNLDLFNSIELGDENKPKYFNGQVNAIELSDIVFWYKKEKIVLNKVTCLLKLNVKYAVLGESGAGKTTLIDIILGLLIPIKGEVRIQAGEENIFVKDIRSFYLPQVPVIFSGTVEDNLKYFNQNSITKDDMVCALKKVNLWEYFNNQDGLVTELDESGSNLSEGQKQRLCLAKVFLNQYHLIVLDEFTSAIDQKSKNIILDAVKKIENTIIIFITHDKETAEIADEVLELKNGKVHILEKHDK